MTHTPERILADVLAAPPRRGWTAGPARAPFSGVPRPQPLLSDHYLRVRRAVTAALDRYPGPVGQAVASALLDYAEQDWCGEPTGLSERLVTELLEEPAG